MLNLFIIESMFSENAELVFDPSTKSEKIKSSGPEGTTVSSTPYFVPGIDMDNISNIISQLISDFGDIPIKIHLIDPNYRIRFFYTEKGKEEYEKLLKLIKEFEMETHCCSFEEFLKTYSFIVEDDYIFASYKTYKDNYEYVAYLDGILDLNRYYIHGCSTVDDILNYISPLNIFKGPDLREYQTTNGQSQFEDKKVINKMINDGILQLSYLIDAGCLEAENFIQREIPSWVLQVENLFMKLVIYHNELFPRKLNFGPSDNSNGKKMQEYFCESGKYRQLIVQCMCLTVYNYNKLNGKQLPSLESYNMFIVFKNKDFLQFLTISEDIEL